MTNLWMVRSPQGTLASQWEAGGYVAIGYGTPTDLTACVDRNDLARVYQAQNKSRRNPASDIGQLAKLRFEMQVGDDIITYDSAAREYLLGRIDGPYVFATDKQLPHRRPVKWRTRVSRDALSPESLNTLGSLLSVFRPNDDAAEDIRAAASGRATPLTESKSEVGDTPAESVAAPPRTEVTAEARERLKDRISRMSWQEVQLLVAGLLRSMGFGTRVAPSGADRGRDVIASRDGLGLEPPRIVAEVKHREAQMSAGQVRSFISALHSTDRGLYVSTGGFTKEARYEADRATPPVTLLDLTEFAAAIVENYDNADYEMRSLLPMIAVYYPVDDA